MARATTSGTGIAGSGHGHKGLVRRVFDSMVTAREHEARRYVNGYLATLDDATLADLGYERKAVDVI